MLPETCSEQETKAPKMSKETINEYTRNKRHQYVTHPSKTYRSRLLDEYCATTGRERKYAQKLLSGKRKGDGLGRKNNTGRPRKYGEEEQAIIHKIWKISEQPCGKRLKQTIALLLPSYQKRYGKIGKESISKLLEISPAQLDRILSDKKVSKGKGKWWLKRPTVEALREKIAIRAESWAVEESGWLEVDSVALCGGDMSGSFIWILTLTDIYSGWTEIVPMWNRSAKRVVDHYEHLIENTPFEWKGIDSDNGGEFISWEAIKWKSIREQLGHQLELTRSRPYHKNDQSRVEQKNYTHVRQFLGYDRLDYQQLMESISETCRAWSLWNNLYRVQMKQERSQRIGSRRKRSHEKQPRTPAQRIIEKTPTPEIKSKLEELYKNNDALELHEECERGLEHIFQLLQELRKNEPLASELEADEISAKFGKLTLRYAPFQLAKLSNKTRLPSAS